MGGAFAMLKLSWKVSETRDLLEEGKIGNAQLSEAEMEIMEARLNRLERERDRFIGEKELMERHALPIMREVLAHRREQQEKAAGGALVQRATTPVWRPTASACSCRLGTGTEEVGMRGMARGGLLGAVLLGLPALARAQGYEVLTLAEAAYLYSGLEVQETLRTSSLRQLPQVIMVCCTIWLVYRRVTSPRPQPITGIVAYVVSCGLILVLFWPEAAPRFLTVRAVIPAGGVTSYIALQNGMTNVDARSSGLVPRQLLTLGTGGTQVPQALDLILRAITEMPLLLGDAIYPGLNRPFSRVGVLSDFIEQVETNPPASLRHRMPQFVDECYLPSLESLMKDKPEPTLRGENAVELGHVGTSFRYRDTGPARRGRRLRQRAVPPRPRRARRSTADMEQKTLQYLRRQRTAQGSNKARVVRDNLGIAGQGAGADVLRPRDGAADGNGAGAESSRERQARPGRELGPRLGLLPVRPDGALQVGR